MEICVPNKAPKQIGDPCIASTPLQFLLVYVNLANPPYMLDHGSQLSHTPSKSHEWLINLSQIHVILISLLIHSLIK